MRAALPVSKTAPLGVVNDQRTTKANINKLIEFRQAVCEHGMTTRRDTLFNVLDALLCEGSVGSFVILSQSEQFQCKCSSLYAALADGRKDSEWLRKYRAEQNRSLTESRQASLEALGHCVRRWQVWQF